MHMSVRDTLAEPALRELKLIAGRAGLDRQVSRVSVMEVPGGGELWSRGGELFMSTLHALRDDREAQMELLRTMHADNAAALCLHPGFDGQQFLDDLVKVADECEFPLITMPQDMPYAVVTDAVVGGLRGRQAAIIQRSAAIHRELIRETLRGHDLDAICSVVSRRTLRPVAVVGPDGLEVLAHGGSLPEMTRRIEDLLQYRGRFSHQRKTISVPIHPVLDTGGPDHVLKISIATADGSVTQVAAPVVAGSEIVAYLITWELEERLTEFDLSVLAHACTAAGLVVLRRMAVVEAERRVQQDFYGAAISGELSNIESAEGRAENAGITLVSRYLVGVLPFEHPLPATEIADIQHWPGSVSISMDQIQVLVLSVPSTENQPIARATTILENLRRSVLGERIDRSVGLSRVVPSVLDLPLALKQARTALETADHLNLQGQVVCYDNLGVYQLLGQVRDSSMLGSFAEDAVGLLMTQRGGKELLATLEAYLDSQGSHLAAAESLSVHPNTVKYRIARVRELLGNDALLQPDRRLGLHLALKAQRIID
jgi:PucR family transcriptional regulator, purine catabolism regulatory protein